MLDSLVTADGREQLSDLAAEFVGVGALTGPASLGCFAEGEGLTQQAEVFEAMAVEPSDQGGTGDVDLAIGALRCVDVAGQGLLEFAQPSDDNLPPHLVG